MSLSFTVSDVIPASPRAIYEAWLDSKAHGKMTGSKAKVSAKVGGAFTAWDTYISGTNLELVPGKRIVQAWRSADFAPSDKDSRLSVTLKKVAGGTKVTLRHTKVPDGQTGYEEGWRESYFEPMKAYFAKVAKAKAKAAQRPRTAKPKTKPARQAR